MLALFRSKKSSLKWVLWLVIVVLGAGMVLLFVNPPSGPTGTLAGEVALVAGKPIGIQEFRREYGNLLRLYQQQFGDQFEQFREQLQLGDQALNRLISQYAISYEAERLGLSATDEEIAERISALPVFQEGETKRFVGVTRYQQILAANNLSTAEFEAGIRRQVLREKLISLLTAGIEPEPEEVRQEFANRNQQVRVSYAAFDPEDSNAESVSDQQLKSYYEENSSKYTIAEKRKVSYLRVPVSPASVTLTEPEIEERMQAIPLQQQVRASHILFRVPPEGDDSAARRKAQDVLRRIRSGADFAEMARTFSEDDRAPEDGDLGFFPRGQMVPEFENVAFSLKVGEVSEPIKTPFGIHIIKVTAAPATPEEAQRMVAEYQLRNEKAEVEAQQRASASADKLRSGTPVGEVAGSEGLQVRESDYFTLVEADPLLGVRGDFNQQVFALSQGEVFAPYLSGNGYLVGTLDDVQAAELQPLDEVRERVVEDYMGERREELAQERAREFFRTAREAGSLAAAGDQEEIPVTTTGFFAKGATIDDVLKFSPILHERAFTMSVGEISPPVPIAGKQVVFEVVDKTEIDPSAFEAARGEIARSLRQNKQNEFANAYIQNVVDRLRREEQIAVNQEMLDAVTS